MLSFLGSSSIVLDLCLDIALDLRRKYGLMWRRAQPPALAAASTPTL
jgi:hypothetical protein